mmetsp:Transcript_32049/g.70068  ORF Transcript_32049/g.70068 Transcript_32049/m.70068 type:complete len:90 (+) Transcript_32049:2696-2965(+)
MRPSATSPAVRLPPARSWPAAQVEAFNGVTQAFTQGELYAQQPISDERDETQICNGCPGAGSPPLATPAVAGLDLERLGFPSSRVACSP